MCPFRQEDVQHLIGGYAGMVPGVRIDKFVVARMLLQQVVGHRFAEVVDLDAHSNSVAVICLCV
jgi:hypothetical protein